MYNYQTEKPKLFTEDGQQKFIAIRDRARDLLARGTGAIRMQEIIANVGGDVWFMLACVDRLVETKELHDSSKEGCAAQHRVFFAP